MNLNEHQTQTELDRFILLRERDGQDAALVWLRRTLNAYREAVAKSGHFAASPPYRDVFKAAIDIQETLLEHAEAGNLDDYIASEKAPQLKSQAFSDKHH